MRYNDFNIDRKNNLQNEHLRRASRLTGGEPIFSHIEFSICDLCNRTCEFCPRSDPSKFPNKKEYLPLELYEKILRDLSVVHYSGRLSYSGFSEPFYHKKISEMISLTKEILPESTLEIVTNGDMLTKSKLQKVFDAGLDRLLVSMYDGAHQIEHFQDLVASAGVDSNLVLLRPRYLAATESFGINLSNRAGTVVNLTGIGVTSLNQPLLQKCFYTHYRMMVDHDGSVLLCPHDWTKKIRVGDLSRESIVDVWTGEALSRIRSRLGKGDRNFSPCNVCDVDGTLQGSEHYLAWQSI